MISVINTLSLRINSCHFPDISKCIFLNENVWILIDISLKFVPKGPINNIPALVEIMAWCRPSDKPLSEPMIVSLLMNIYASLSFNELILKGDTNIACLWCVHCKFKAWSISAICHCRELCNKCVKLDRIIKYSTLQQVCQDCYWAIVLFWQSLSWQIPQKFNPIQIITEHALRCGTELDIFWHYIQLKIPLLQINTMLCSKRHTKFKWYRSV